MAVKNRQNRSMGNPAQYRQDLEWDADERIIKLEERVANLEQAMNTILQEWPVPQETEQSPKNPNPKKKPSSQPPPQAVSEHNAQVQADAQARNTEAAERLSRLIADGKKRTEAEIREELDISKKMFQRIRKRCELEHDDNPVREDRFYFISTEDEESHEESQ